MLFITAFITKFIVWSRFIKSHSAISVSKNNSEIFSIMKAKGQMSSSRALRCNFWDTGKLRHFSSEKLPPVLGAGNWVCEKSCDNSLTRFRWRSGLKVTFRGTRGPNYISLLSPLSFAQWHEMNWWDRGRGKCQCKCLQWKWSCLFVHSDGLKGGGQRPEWERGAALHTDPQAELLIAAAAMLHETTFKF